MEDDSLKLETIELGPPRQPPPAAVRCWGRRDASGLEQKQPERQQPMTAQTNLRGGDMEDELCCGLCAACTCLACWECCCP
ncbi:hypothetical protein NKR19_g10148 [Coniochaeta hoffmannii]|uniref:Uncharacterized protein n=1 Tax=Coniochaeta hoffmannii TaxID=91930 RepID=A0AA38R963_9PEZI|nr:hypothetical protein NKR19_g10148 [Coniochaeta hoffmannii]